MLTLVLSLVPALAAPPAPPVIPLRHAHAHNDYQHRRPLLDALDRGFCSVEADIFLVRGELLVGHTWLDLRRDRTLEKLYLQPLRERAKAGKGRVYPAGPDFYLLIDIKTDGKETYAVLDKLLARYADILSVTDNGRFQRKAVTVVLSGNRPAAVVRAQKVRYAGLDGRAGDLKSSAPAHLVPYVSMSWTAHFGWRGKGPMPKEEKAKLRTMVQQAHKHGRLLRFWATPENEAVWRELRAAGVDWINTDKLDELRAFLLKGNGPSGSAPRGAPR
jgi:hypothetical protein